MHLEVIENFEALQNVRDGWAKVYDSDPEASFFLSHKWILDWLRFRISPWFVLAVKPTSNSSDYVAFMPLRWRAKFDTKIGFTNELKLAGADFSDYTGLICCLDAECQAIPKLAGFIRRNLNWATFRLDNLMMSDRRRKLFFNAFEKRKFASRSLRYFESGSQVDHGICPAADLPETWDDYLSQLSSNNRQKIRRLLKKVDGGEQFRITVLEGPEADEGIDVLLDLWRTKWLPVKGKERVDDIIACNRYVLRRAARDGTLFLPVFWDGERPVVVLGTLVDERKRSMRFLITGRDESFADLPAGYLLHAFSIRHAISEGLRTYDFLRGNEPYKYHFATREARMHACEMRTRDRQNLQGTRDLTCLRQMLQIALDFEKKNELTDAEAAYRQIVELAPEHGLALYRLGRLYASKGEHDVAISFLQRSVEAEPEGDNAWKWLARSLQAQGELKAALDAWSKVKDAQSGNEEAIKAVAELRLATVHEQPPSLSVLWPVASPAVPSLAQMVPQLSIPAGRFAINEP